MKTPKYLFAIWLENKATPEELLTLKNNGDLDWLQKIKDETDTWTLPSVPSNYQTIIDSYKKKSKFSFFLEYYNREIIAIAALFLLFFGISFLYLLSQAASQTISTNVAETKTMLLPDKSVVTLQENSSITYVDADDFLENRKLELKGNANFNVQSKGDFEVNFALGKVNVLGTKFQINETETNFTVFCMEGKIKVTPLKGNKSAFLEGGERVEFQTDISSLKKSYVPQNSDATFTDEQLKGIISFLYTTYGIEVQYDAKLDLNRKFTGKIPTDDLIGAMYVISNVMKISYTFKEDKKTILFIYP